MEYRIHARVEPRTSDTFVARVWVSHANDPNDAEVSVAHVCHPCSREDATRQCEHFVSKVMRQLLAEGHRIAEVRVN